MKNLEKLPARPRTRFAPSPTGTLHIGGARTALFCWLFAQATRGTFVLRIEDTDRERSTQESVEAIFDGMGWLGLEADEGPYFQTHRFDRYKEVLEQLLAQGKAYYCYCTKDELDQKREAQKAAGLKPRYDGHCRNRTEARPGVEPTIRFKNPVEGDVVFDDLVRGPIRVSNLELDDLIIARSDGTPTYNFTVVVDDSDMAITHVIRGDDHINNTPRQINIFSALDLDAPTYAHVPMILGEDGARLSKRHGAVGVMSYQEQGFLPEALLSYLVRLGWSHGDKEEFTIDEMIELFKLEDINRAPSVFNQEKLLWLNSKFIKNMPPSDLAERLKVYLSALDVHPDDDEHLAKCAELLRERCKTLVELAESCVFFYSPPNSYDEVSANKFLTEATGETLGLVLESLRALDAWTVESIKAVLQSIGKNHGVKFGMIAQPIRTAVVGVAMSPSIDETLHLLGQSETVKRIGYAIEWIHREHASRAAGDA